MSKKTEKLWSFFSKNNPQIPVNKKNLKATCQIKVPAVTGAICGKVLATPDSNTSALRSHLKSQHPEAAREMFQFEADFVKQKIDNEKKLERLYFQAQKKTPKRDQPDYSSSDNSEIEMDGTPGNFFCFNYKF
jgi:hypothetical protein